MATLFNDWLLNEKKEQERLKELNEAFDEKDEKRITDLIAKAKGDRDKENQLARAMANVIKDADKAIRRGEAAEDQNAYSVAKIFFDRAEELGADVSSKTKEEVKETPEESEEAPEETSAEEKPVKEPKAKKEKKEKPAPPAKIKTGDYVRITGQMVIDKKVGAHNKGGWRWIQTSSKGDRELSIEDPQKGTRSGYSRRGMGYSAGSPSSPATASIDSTYLHDHKNEGIFYILVTKAGSQWIEGRALFFNGLTMNRNATIFRLEKKNIGENGAELQIFLDNQTDIDTLKGANRFFLGDEDFVMNKEGKTLEDFVPGIYTLSSLDYDLTRKANSPVVYCSPLNAKEVAFYSILNKAKNLSVAPSEEQTRVIASYLGKQIGAEIEITTSNNFKIPYFKVEATKTKGYLGTYLATPFFTLEKAEAHITELKKKAETEKFPFDVNSLQASASSQYGGRMYYEINLSQIIDYAKLAGIEMKMRKFFEEKKGAITAKRFGF